MKFLKKATNKMAYAKIGFYGQAGSGKTYTAAQVAIGLHKFANLNKPIAMFDTEPAASFIKPYFDQAGIDFYVFDESRALIDLMGFMDEAEQACSIVIIDSITHIWRELQQAHLKKINETRKQQRKPPIFRLEFHHWGAIKEKFGKFTDRYLSSKMHAIVCGRAGSIYEYQENEETGKKELITTGTKMASEKEMGYEPSLLVELSNPVINGTLTNRGFVEKDRANLLNGKTFDFPSFNDFKPHFEFLNLGGEHFGSMETRDSAELFEGESDDGFGYEKRQRVIWGEEIQGLLVKYYPSQTADAKKAKADLIEEFFGTRSWTRVESLQSEKIKEGFFRMKTKLEETNKEGAE